MRLGRLVITPNVDYNSILLKNTHERSSNKDYSVKLWGKFDTVNFDGIQLMCYLHKKEEILQTSECTFKVYKVEPNSWDESFLFENVGVYSTNKFVLSVTQAQLGVTAELDGDYTLAIEASIKRGTKAFKSKIYLNHLGVYDSIFRLRQDVEFLDITKVDE